MSRKYLLLLPLFVLFCVPLVSASYESSLKGYWQFEDNLFDSTDYGNDATYMGNQTPLYVSGYDGQGFYFRGGNNSGEEMIGWDWVNAWNDSSLNISGNAFTLSAWIKPSNVFNQSSQYTMMIIGKHQQYAMFFSGLEEGMGVTGIGIVFWNGSDFSANQNFIGSMDAFSSDAWYHILGTYNGSELNFYINGTKNHDMSIGSHTGNVHVNTDCVVDSWFRIGGNYNRSMFNGTIDNVMVWDRGLTENEVQGVFNGTFSGELPEEEEEPSVGDSFPMLWILPIMIVLLGIISIGTISIRKTLTAKNLFEIFLFIVFLIVFTMAITGML